MLVEVRSVARAPSTAEAWSGTLSHRTCLTIPSSAKRNFEKKLRDSLQVVVNDSKLLYSVFEWNRFKAKFF